MVFKYQQQQSYVWRQIVFSDIDESFRSTVTFGENFTISIMGKGNRKICTKENSDQIISSIFFILDLKINLLSVGWLQDKGYEISIKDGVYRI